MHPLDNVQTAYDTPRLVINATDPASGTVWQNDHFFAPGCTAAYKRGKAQLTCPAVRYGYTCTTPTSIVEKATRFSGVAFYATKLDTSGFTAVTPLVGGLIATKMEHRWRVKLVAGVPYLYVSDKFVFGIEQQVSQEALELTNYIRQGMSAPSNGDMDLALAKAALHEIEQVGFLPEWLPKLYRAAGDATSG